MDIAALSIVNSNTQLREAASLCIMKKVMDTSKENASEMTKMMESLAQPNLGSIIDAKA